MKYSRFAASKKYKFRIKTEMNMKKQYVSPVIEDLYMEPAEVIAASTLDMNEETVTKEDILSRDVMEDLLSGNSLGIFQ